MRFQQYKIGGRWRKGPGARQAKGKKYVLKLKEDKRLLNGRMVEEVFPPHSKTVLGPGAFLPMSLRVTTRCSAFVLIVILLYNDKIKRISQYMCKMYVIDLLAGLFDGNYFSVKWIKMRIHTVSLKLLS